MIRTESESQNTRDHGKALGRTRQGCEFDRHDDSVQRNIGGDKAANNCYKRRVAAWTLVKRCKTGVASKKRSAEIRADVDQSTQAAKQKLIDRWSPPTRKGIPVFASGSELITRRQPKPERVVAARILLQVRFLGGGYIVSSMNANYATGLGSEG